MKSIPLKTPLLKPGTDLLATIDKALKTAKIKLETGNVLVVASKIVALSQGKLFCLKDIKPSKKAYKLAKKYHLSPAMSQLILDESEETITGVKRAILTLKNGILIANAGVDASNVPAGSAITWPENMPKIADQIKAHLQKKYKVKAGVIIADSHVIPLRLGTTGLAIAIAGFEGVIDERGKKDLYGEKMHITQKAIADNLAVVANYVMGEVSEKTPLAVIKDAHIKLSNKSAAYLTNKLKIKPKDCLYHGYNL